MSVCACGRNTNDGQSNCDRCTALNAFGLTRAATRTEIKDAYRVLAKVWHPDRFQNDEQLRSKAEEKLKEINSAYQLLTTTVDEGAYGKPHGPTSRPAESRQASTDAPGWTSYERPTQKPFTPSSNPTRRASKKWLAVAVAILVAAGIWIYLRYGGITIPADNVHSADAEKQTAAKGAVPAEAIGQTSQQKQRRHQAVNDGSNPGQKAEAHTRTNTMASNRASLVVYPDEDPLAPYFTVGSTRNDVVRIQGTPSRVAGNVFAYGLSEVYFQNGRVESWHVDPSTPLKARMPQE
jgi:curved DNA-binding protein CbpA